MCVQELGTWFLTPNLHALLCWHARQVGRRGPTNHNQEVWGERSIGKVKARTKYRTSMDPEKTIVWDYLVDLAFACMKHHQGAEQLDVTEILRRQEQGPEAGPSAAAEPSAEAAAHAASYGLAYGTQTLLTKEEVRQQFVGNDRACRDLLDALDLNQNGGQPEWSQADLSASTIHSFTRAQLPGGVGQVYSEAHTLSRTRDGAAVVISFVKQTGALAWFGASVTRILHMQHPGHPGLSGTALVALCNLYTTTDVTDRGKDLSELLLQTRLIHADRKHADNFKPKWREFPVLLHNIHLPAVQHIEKCTFQGRPCDVLTFIPCSVTSGRRRCRPARRPEASE